MRSLAFWHFGILRQHMELLFKFDNLDYTRNTSNGLYAFI